MTIETYLDVPASWATFASGEYQSVVRGLRTWKLSDDLSRYAEIIKATRPEVIIETGTKFGGSAVWFSQSGAEIISVDIDGSFSEEARHTYPEIHWIIGDSLDGKVLDCVADLVGGRRAMVVLDSEHAAPHVAAEINAYSGFVSDGCYLVVEDGIFDLVDPSLSHLGGARIPTEGGPLRAIELTLAGHPDWTRDTEIERLTPRTYHAAGFWIRADGGDDAKSCESTGQECSCDESATDSACRHTEGCAAHVVESQLSPAGMLVLPEEIVFPDVATPPVAAPKKAAARKPKKAAATVPVVQP